MPVYEYRCLDCGERFERFTHAMRDPEGLACAACGGSRVERQLSVFAARQAEVEGGGCGPCCASGADGPCCPWRADAGGCC